MMPDPEAAAVLHQILVDAGFEVAARVDGRQLVTIDGVEYFLSIERCHAVNDARHP